MVFSPLRPWSAASPYALALGLAAFVCAVLAVIGWRRRSRPGGMPFVFMMTAGAVWALLYSFELMSPGLTAKVLWAKTEYLGIAVIPLAWFLFARAYTGAMKTTGRGPLALLYVIPALTVTLVATNELHHLVWSSLSIGTSGPFPVLVLAHGPWFWVFMVYSYGLLLAGSAVLVRTVLSYPQLYRRQVGMLVVAVAAPWIGNGLSIFRVVPGGVDVTPFAFTVAGLALCSRDVAFAAVRSASRTHSGRAQPSSREDEGRGAGARLRWYGGERQSRGRFDAGPVSPQLRGQSGSELLGGQLPAPREEGSDVQFDVSLGEGTSLRHYDIVCSPLGFVGGVGSGWLLVLRDITDRKRMETRVAESEERYRVLADTTSDLIFSFDRNLRLTGINRAAAESVGLSPEEALGRSSPTFGFRRRPRSGGRRNVERCWPADERASGFSASSSWPMGGRTRSRRIFIPSTPPTELWSECGE